MSNDQHAKSHASLFEAMRMMAAEAEEDIRLLEAAGQPVSAAKRRRVEKLRVQFEAYSVVKQNDR